MSVATSLTPDQSEVLIYGSLISQGFPDTFSKLATAQSGHETQGWTSPVYNNDNNAFGYGWNGSSYHSYNSVEASVNEYAVYVRKKVASGLFPDLATITDPDQWAQILKSVNYYTDYESIYANGIWNYYDDSLGGGGSGSPPDGSGGGGGPGPVSSGLAISSGVVIFGAVLAFWLLSRPK